MKAPRLVYADENGQIFDHPVLELAGSSAGRIRTPEPQELIPMPEGSELFLLPGRYPVGFNRTENKMEILEDDPFSPGEKVQAVAAFMAPAHTQILTAAYRTKPDAPVLPLFSYTAVGWMDGKFWVCGLRVDSDTRQDIRFFDREKIEKGVRKKVKEYPDNRLVRHLSKCALTYGCPAANNYFLERCEAPLPTSPSCNARCLGCISLQKDSGFCASQDRISFVPTPEEIEEVAVPHLEKAPRPVVSFGQGCEGEPLMQGKTLEKAISKIRNATSKGTVNLNTNGSMPDTVSRLMDSGLDSIRVSLNSCREDYFNAYYRPLGYSLDDLKKSLRVVKEKNGFASINYLLLPGLNDEREEFEDLCNFIEDTEIDLIQMRNLNIDPEWYLKKIGFRARGRPLGLLGLMEQISSRFPHIRFGYFNPPLRC
ncbi:MAG: radical SAM protein [Deltaproteobacteria bacterium]|nr:MAG: radical SAM protein [Deltaproteobacteria bacterium]